MIEYDGDGFIGGGDCPAEPAVAGGLDFAFVAPSATTSLRLRGTTFWRIGSWSLWTGAATESSKFSSAGRRLTFHSAEA